MNQIRLIIAAILGITAMLAGHLALAENESGMEEIIVTARQQSEGLQDVPVTIAALTEEDLDRYNITDLP